MPTGTKGNCTHLAIAINSTYQKLPVRKSKASEARRVAQEVAAIRAALHQRGYRTRKSPEQPVWIIFVNAECCYLLTYQPAPISDWVLHLQGKDIDCHTLETIIQRAITRSVS
jgi:hypothetical protein